MKGKRWLAAILAVSISASMAMSGCSSSSSSGTQSDTGKSTNSPVTITVWAWDDNFNIPIIKKAGELYSKEHPNVKINAVSMSKQDVYTKLQTGLAAGGKSLPDIVLCEDYSIGRYLKAYSSSFADLSSAINYDDFLPFKKAAVTYNGKQYGVPMDTGPTSLFYRLDLVEKAGFKESDMQNITWDRFIEIGKAVTKATGVKMYTQISSNITSEVRFMMQSAGQWYFDKDGNINLKNNAAAKEALETIKKMRDADIVFQAASDGDRAGSLNKGEAASIVNGPWFVGTLKAAKDQSGKWRVAPTPKLSTADSKNASNVGGSSWYVMNKSANKDTAIDLLKTAFDGNNDFYSDILVNNGALCSYTSAFKGDVFNKEDEFFGGQRINSMFVSTLYSVQGINYGGYVSEANDAVNAAAVGYFTGSSTIDKALDDAEQQLKNQIQ